MEKHLLKLHAWATKNKPTQQEKQTLYREVIRRAEMRKNNPPQKSLWYHKLFTPVLPLATVPVLVMVIIFTQTNTFNTTTSIYPEPNQLPDTEQHINQYQVLSAYEQVDKISKEKASLEKIIEKLPTETVASNVKDELSTIEKYIQSSQSPDPTKNPVEKIDKKSDNEKKPIITETVEKKPDTKEDSQLPITTLATEEADINEKKIDTVKKYYEKIKEYELAGNYTEALILIGEVKKIITPEKEPIVPPLKGSIKKQ